MTDTPEAPQDNDVDTAEVTTSDGADNDAEDDSDVFPREYVESLRKECKGYRDRAKAADDRADDLAKRLHTALVERDGRLVNPAELPYHPDHLDSTEALDAAISAALLDRPYLQKRTTGDVGMGQRGKPTVPQDFSGLFRTNR